MKDHQRSVGERAENWISERFGPTAAGLASAAATIAILTLGPAVTVTGLTAPSAAFFHSLVQIGAALLIVYGVEMAWAPPQFPASGNEHENWLGFVTGIGISALLALGAALASAEHVAQQSEGFLARFGFWLSVVPLLLLGTIIALYPMVVRAWRASDRS